MKSLLLLALLTSLVSCVTKTEEKSCTYNGEPCREESVSPNDNGNRNTLQEAILQVSVESPINFTPYSIEFLENTFDSKELDLNGEYSECKAKTQVGTQLTYKISQGYLTTMEERTDGTVNLQTFYRKAGPGNSLEGSWESSMNFGRRVEITRLEIIPGRLVMKVECRIRR